MPLDVLLKAQTPQSPGLRRRLWNYARWSTPEQSWGTSDERQTEMGLKYAADHAMQFIDRYRDEGMSGYKGKNAKIGSLSQFLRDMGSNDPSGPMPRAGDAIGVDEFSRLGRDEALDAAYVVKQILDAGISIIHYRYGLEIDREQLRRQPWLNNMLMSELNRAHNESYQKSINMREAKEIARKRGRENGEQISGRACPGWLILTEDHKHYQEHPERATIVRMIFRWADRGVSEGEIARRLNQMRIPTFATIGRRRQERMDKTGWEPIWYPASVHQLLVNRGVIGWCQPRRIEDDKRLKAGSALRLFPLDVLVPGDDDASEAMFYRVQRTLEETAGKGRGRKNKYKNIVAGLIVCGVCGGPVHIHSAPRSTHGAGWQRGYLSCERATWGACDSQASFPYGPFEDMLFRLSDTSLARLVPETPDDTAARRLADVETIIAGREDELAAQQHAYGTLKSETAKTNALAEIDRLGGELDQLKRDRDELNRAVKTEQHAASRAFIERWHEARSLIESPDEETRLDARRMMAAEYRRIIDAVILYDERIEDDREPGEVWPGDVCGPLIGERSIVIRMKPHGEWHVEYDVLPNRIVGARQVCQARTGDTYYGRNGLGRLIDRTGEAVLITHHNLSMFRLAGEPLDLERLVHVDGYIDLQLAGPIQVGTPYEQRVNRSVEKIRHTIEALRRDGKRVTKLAVAQVGRMSHTTVHKHWVKATSA